MRHGKKFNHLGRTASHRKAMLSNMASSLILHKRLSTTLAKAKALRKYVEPLLTKSKSDTTHSRRTVFAYLQNKESVKELFDEVSVKIANRPGGYTRIIKTGYRLGDNAEMCVIELVDYNEDMLTTTAADASGAKKTRRRGGKKKSEGTAAAEATATAETTEAPVESNDSNEETKNAE
ncbi:50S ribosomal protein L17 [Pontibacter oryzae]|uniref:Large ribosomal subunit protein bL17 n=1 Tax=Pontibacter oryzae TaxID=2304593 RepID=A0A399S4I7_9BACT|nr:50S ribosomal protein L17 [Pontibacter oryzae]RIJ36797.1 50S ribosomal protein L17 [Pontibacter oryzae]